MSVACSSFFFTSSSKLNTLSEAPTVLTKNCDNDDGGNAKNDNDGDDDNDNDLPEEGTLVTCISEHVS